MPEEGAAAPRRYSLFEVYGVELEYMIVSTEDLNVLPITDRLIEAECGRIESEIDLGPVSWSNELALHVVELKTTTPASSLTGLADQFQQHVHRVNERLQPLGGRLLPSAMHPWMNPFKEMRLWPHEYSPVYEAFNRIFDCRGHGWANLQSVHLNLPFNGDAEFARLHAAIRLVLPLLPALAAASPVMDGRLTGLMDNRLEVYRKNSAKVPQVAAKVIPEQAFSADDYRRLILNPLYQAIAPLDPDGVLQDEFLNARGAIARFGRGSIEIRVIDIQECPAADLAVLQLLVAVLQALVEERWSSLAEQQKVEVEPLHDLLLKAIRDAEQAKLDHPRLLTLFGLNADNPISLQQLWQHFAQTLALEMSDNCRQALTVILDHGPLARRLTGRLQSQPVNAATLKTTWEKLADCLQTGTMFVP